MNGGARISARAIVMLLVVALGLAALPEPATAHPSALDALTVDLLLDQAGLVVVDAAANGHTYDTAPHSAAQRRLATAVLDALGVPHDTAQVDPDSSTLYHEVGFNVALHEAFANTDVPGAVRIDTGPLQKVAAGVGDLILDVCGVAKPGLTLAVTATSPAAAPDPGGAGAPQTDRTDCQTWARHADDTSVIITARAKQAGAAVPEVREHVELPCAVLVESTDPTFVAAYPILYSPGTRQAHVTGPRSPHMLQAEFGVDFRANARVDLVVPKARTGRVSLGPRDGPRASRRLTMPRCATGSAQGWTLSGIRIWVDEPGCVPITVQMNRRTVRTVRLPVGEPCPARARP